jgi:hypothetical protein
MQRSTRPLRPALVTLVIGLVVTGLLAWVSQAQYGNNEHRLLKLRVRDASALLIAAVPNIQTPLASATELANATGGDVRRFIRFTAPYVGSSPGHQFVSLSLWDLATPQRGPIAVEGLRPKLGSSLPAAAAYFARAGHVPGLTVTGLLAPPGARLGYAVASHGRFIAYGESELPQDRRSRLQSNSAFAGLDYAIYLGRGEHPQDLLVTDAAHPPLRGRTDAETVPFGNGVLTLVMSSRVPLAGALPRALPWIIAIVGVLLSGGAATGALWLTRRRRNAELLAGRLEIVADENERLYGEQRGIAQTLQHALLPDQLPQVPGVQTEARYRAGESGVDIGGDWYDVIDLGGGRLLLVVGDVSGRGLRAATTMASLRFATHAYAAEGDPPDAILTKLCALVSVSDGGQIATILCVSIDVELREITIASAGHLPPLLIDGEGSRYLKTPVGVPIGVEPGAAYTTTTSVLARNSTLLAFTDGLVEQRGESLDQGLERLRALTAAGGGALPDLLDKLMSELPGGPSMDDSAIVGVRWTS